MSFVEINDIKKAYGKKQILKGISFSIEKGEIFSLLGPNGAGKTTLIRIMAEGISYRGKIMMDGQPIEKMRHKIGYCPQEGIVYDELTVKENLDFYAALYHSDRSEAERFIKLFKLPAQKKAKKLSGGMKKKLSLSLALLHSPELLILDEPTTGLDVQSRLELWDTVKSLKKEGKTIIITTHYMEEAEKLSDRVAIIDRGKIIAVGKVGELKKNTGLKSAIEIKGDFRGSPKGFLEKDGALVYYTENPGNTIAEAVKAASGYGTIKEALVREPTLEDVFIKLTGKKLDEEAGE